MTRNRYCMSFTTGGLFHNESLKLAILYLEMESWNSVQKKAISGNLLQARTISTSIRVLREVIDRLKTLNHEELDLLVYSNPQDQKYLLWLAICRRYKFIADFSIEVLRERYITLKTDLNNEDFDSFLNKKTECHPELDKLSLSTRAKLRQVLFKMLRESDLLTEDNIINAAMLSPILLKIIARVSSGDVLFFPAFESDIKGISK